MISVLALVVASLVVIVTLSGCFGRIVTSGTISGYAFTVVSGELRQMEPDGPVFARDEPAVILLDATVADVGMTDPAEVQLHMQYALADGGALAPRVFTSDHAADTTGLWLELTRDGNSIDYEVGSGTTGGISGTFADPPADPDIETWIVSEFYNASTPGYGAVSGVAVWPHTDVTPDFCGEEVEQHDLADPPGTRIVFVLASGTLTRINFVTVLSPPVSSR